MTGMGGHPASDPRLALAATLLRLARTQPLDVETAAASLRQAALLLPQDSAAPAWQLPEAGRLFHWRGELLRLAQSLLQQLAANTALDLQPLRSWLLARELLAQALEPVSESGLQRLHHCLLPTATPTDDMAADMLAHRDAAFEWLEDASFWVRLLALSWQLTAAGQDPAPGQLAAAARILPCPEQNLRDGLGKALALTGVGAEDKNAALDLADLQRQLRRYQELGMALLPLAELEQGRAVLQALSPLATQTLGAPLLALEVEQGQLRVCSDGDLEGHVLRGEGGRSLAAEALQQRQRRQRSLTAPGLPVIDRQVAARLGAKELLALPLGEEETLAVLLLDAAVDSEDLDCFLIHACHWLTRAQRDPVGAEPLPAAAPAGVDVEQRLRELVHEMSGPLAVMQNYLHLLAAGMEPAEPAAEQVRLIGAELRRLDDLLQSSLRAERSPPAGGAADVNAVVARVLALFEPTLGNAAGIELRFQAAADLPAVAISDSALQQVLSNLLRNAAEALPEGGCIEVAAELLLDEQGQSGVELRVADNGPGVDPELLARIFESGVSAKGRGRGLGLPIVKRLLEPVGAAIRCRSRPGQGSTFLVWLPLA